MPSPDGFCREKRFPVRRDLQWGKSTFLSGVLPGAGAKAQCSGEEALSSRGKDLSVRGCFQEQKCFIVSVVIK